MFSRKQRRSLAGIVALAALTAVPATPGFASSDSTQVGVTAGGLAFETAPDLPALSGVSLTGDAQTVTAQMPNWAVSDATGSGSGWNVTVQGDGSAGKSAVFKEYCTDPAATNGCDTAVSGGVGPGYVTSSPKTLAANSLTLASTGGGFTALSGTTGSAPTHSCAASCNVDSGSAVKIGSAAADGGMGSWRGDSYGATGLSLAIPTTLKTIGTGNKVYRVDLTWTLSSGPGA